MLEPSTIGNLTTVMRGDVIGPDDPRYESARRVYNSMIDKRPSLIARCTDAADVIAAVSFAHDAGLRVAIRSGGHNAGGLGVCDDGLVIDLSRMSGVRVTTGYTRGTAARTVSIEIRRISGDRSYHQALGSRQQ